MYVAHSQASDAVDFVGQGTLTNRLTKNDPEFVAELQARYPLSEHAHVTNNVEKPVEMFWSGAQAGVLCRRTCRYCRRIEEAGCGNHGLQTRNL